jgi:hypothetical protein
VSDVIPAQLNEWIDWDDLGDCVEDGPVCGDFSFARCRSAALRLKIKTVDRLYSGQFLVCN